jgi:hypothetical protein
VKDINQSDISRADKSEIHGRSKGQFISGRGGVRKRPMWLEHFRLPEVVLLISVV